jgi:hypothetical protein
VKTKRARGPLLRTIHRARNHRFRFALEIGFLVLLSSSPAPGQPIERPMTVEDQFRLRQPGDPILSPDGRWVLYTIERTVLAENARHSSIWLAPSDGSQPPREFLQEGDASPMWAPSSRSVFFLRGVTAGERQSRERPGLRP